MTRHDKNAQEREATSPDLSRKVRSAFEDTLLAIQRQSDPSRRWSIVDTEKQQGRDADSPPIRPVAAPGSSGSPC